MACHWQCEKDIAPDEDMQSFFAFQSTGEKERKRVRDDIYKCMSRGTPCDIEEGGMGPDLGSSFAFLFAQDVTNS